MTTPHVELRVGPGGYFAVMSSNGQAWQFAPDNDSHLVCPRCGTRVFVTDEEPASTTRANLDQHEAVMHEETDHRSADDQVMS